MAKCGPWHPSGQMARSRKGKYDGKLSSFIMWLQVLTVFLLYEVLCKGCSGDETDEKRVGLMIRPTFWS